MLKKLLSHSFLYALGPQVPRLAGILVLPLTTQHLTPLDYGVAGLVSAYAGMLSGLRELGLSVVLANTFFNYPKRWPAIWRRLHGFLSLWSVFFALVLAAVLWVTLPAETGDRRAATVLLNCVPLALFETTVTVGSRYLQFAERPAFMSTVTAVTGVTTVILNLAFIVWWKQGFLGWFLSSFCGSALSALLYGWPAYREARIIPNLRFTRRFLRRHLAVSLPLVPHNYSSYLLNGVERMAMDRYSVPVREIGRFNAAAVFGNYVSMGATAVGMAVGPMMTRLYAERTSAADRRCRDLVVFLQGLSLALCATAALWSKEIMWVLIRNAELRVAYPIACIGIMSQSTRPMYWAVANRLAFAERTGQLWKLSFGAGALNVVLCFVSIPFGGIFAAAVATFMAQLMLGFIGFALPQYRSVERESMSPGIWFGAVLACSAAVLALQDVSALAKVVVSIGVAASAGVFVARWRVRLADPT